MSQARTLNDLDFRPRLIMGVEGEKGSGKTALLLSAAMVRPPLSLMRWDFASVGALRAAKKMGLEDSIFVRDYLVDAVVDMEKQAFEAKKYAAELKKSEGNKNPKALAEAMKLADSHLATVKSNAEEVFDDFLNDYKEALLLGGTVAIDTGMELYQAARLATFGLLRQVPQLQYEKTNKLMLDIIAMADNSESNLIFVNKLRDEWSERDGKKYKTGKMITEGWDGLEYPAHVMLRLYREGTKSDPTREGPITATPGQFCLQFLKCNDAPEDKLTGTCHIVEDPMMGFDQVGRLVFEEDW